MERISPTTLRITETSPSSCTPDGGKLFYIDVEAGTSRPKRKLRLRDPFLEADYESLHHRFGGLNKGEDLHQNAQCVSQAIEYYRQRLLDQLELGDLLDKIENIETYAWVSGSNATLDSCTIDCLQWELLEDSVRKSPGTKCIAVTHARRQPEVSPIHVERVGTGPGKTGDKPTIRVLLITARSLPRNGQMPYEDRDPGLADKALRQIQAKLFADKAEYEVDLEVLPGPTFEELTKYLSERPKGYYHIVHLDVHGVVEDGIANLNFADKLSYQEKLISVPAQEIGEVLAERGIKCVILNACDSGRAIGGHKANLSEIFAQLGVSNVLGMSHEFSESAAVIFHYNFYYHLFVDRRRFSEAAGLARAALRAMPERVGKYGQLFKIADWIVPVHYRNGRDFQIVVETEETIGRFSANEGTSLPRRLFQYDRCIIVWHLVKKWMAFIFGFLHLLISRPDKIFTSFPLSLSNSTYQTIQNDNDDSEDLGEGSVAHLDDSTMRLYRDVRSRPIIYYHNGRSDKKTKYLKCLCQQWLDMGVFSNVYFISAQDLVSPKSWLTKTREIWSRFWQFGTDQIEEQCPDDDDFEGLGTLYIFDRIHYLFDDKNPTFTLSQKTLGRTEFLALLARIPLIKQMTNGRPRNSSTRIILTGHDSKDWLRTIIQDSIPCLRDVSNIHPFARRNEPIFFDP